MNIQKITNQLQQLTATSRVVFWQDDAGHFSHNLAEIQAQLPNVIVINTDDTPALQIKVMLDLDRPHDKF